MSNNEHKTVSIAEVRYGKRSDGHAVIMMVAGVGWELLSRTVHSAVD